MIILIIWLRLNLSPVMISWPSYWSPHYSSGDVLRNIDVVVRSKERKKMHVKDLEMKNRYLEGKCRRLSHVLQFFIDENQALQIFFLSPP
ncbi:hypothetical protein Gotur_033436 [Gossypium turneri]